MTDHDREKLLIEISRAQREAAAKYGVKLK